MGTSGGRRERDAGFTLIEVLIALVLFSLIGIAGFSLLTAIIGVQARTDDRLDRLAAMQRAMHVLTLDLQQVAGPPIAVADGAAVFRRYAQAGSASTVTVRYDLSSDTLRRTLVGVGGDQVQTLLTDVGALQWRFFSDGAWRDAWPPPNRRADRVLPEAVALTVNVRPQAGGLSGPLRRVVRLPTVVQP